MEVVWGAWWTACRRGCRCRRCGAGRAARRGGAEVRRQRLAHACRPLPSPSRACTRGVCVCVCVQEDIQYELDRRRPGQSRITTPRKETDTCEVLSGLAPDGRTTLGTPIAILVRNKDQQSGDYSEIEAAYRPSHAGGGAGGVGWPRVGGRVRSAAPPPGRKRPRPPPPPPLFYQMPRTTSSTASVPWQAAAARRRARQSAASPPAPLPKSCWRRWGAPRCWRT